MENKLAMSQEELEKALEKARRDAQEMMEKMTPEEREQAVMKAKKMIDEDQASIQKMLDDVASYVPGGAPKARPKFCANCGAPVSGGKFCSNCGQPL